jgi:hypothetical protein
VTDPQPGDEPREGNLGKLSDEDYFAAIGEFPGAVDEQGASVVGLFDDVVDARASKARAAESGSP